MENTTRNVSLFNIILKTETELKEFNTACNDIIRNFQFSGEGKVEMEKINGNYYFNPLNNTEILGANLADASNGTICYFTNSNFCLKTEKNMYYFEKKHIY
ncbi:hypothetical protein HOD61_02650 [archaeon]|jgi:hypothetical protein|nr:hypothetical protein [archaeon]